MGGLTLAVGGATLVLANRKARGLIAYLALEEPGFVDRERLAGLFWSDVPEPQARSSLRQAIFDIREALRKNDCPALTVNREAVALVRNQINVDVHQLLTAVAAGEASPALLSQRINGEALLESYDDLSSLFGDWLASTRITVQNRLFRELERSFSNESIPRTNRRLLAEAALRLDPLHEGACRAVMRLAAEDGEIGVSLRCYASLYEALGVELDMEPSEATQRLVADIKRGDIGPAPTLVPAIPRTSSSARRRPGKVSLVPDDTPILAVLPLRNGGPEPLPAYLADGIVEDIIHILAGLREPAVISANSTRRLDNDVAEDVVRAAEALGADYVVTGALRAIGGRARLAIELAEATQGSVLWSRIFEVPEAMLFETQAEIAACIANTVAPRVGEAELRASRRRTPDDLGAYHLLLQARDRIFQLDHDALEDAAGLLNRAANLDPDYAPIHAALIDLYSIRIFQGWSVNRDRDTQALEQSARTALRLDPGNGRALALWGHNRTIIGRHYEEALDLLERAAIAAPNDAETLIWTTPTLAYVGRSEEAIGRAERALALSPYDPFIFRYEHFLSIAHFAAGDLDAAAHWGLRSLSRNPNYTSNLRMTVAALAGAARLSEAEPLVKQLMRLQPGLRVGASVSRNAFREMLQREKYANFLRQAGIPE